MWATLAEFVLNRFCVILVSNTSDVHYVADLDYSWPDAELVCYVVKCHSESRAADYCRYLLQMMFSLSVWWLIL